jgi:hypothetical protein
MLAQEHRTGLHSVSTVVYCDRSMLNTERTARSGGDSAELVPLHVAPSLARLLLLCFCPTVVTSLCVNRGVLQTTGRRYVDTQRDEARYGSDIAELM